MLRRITGIAVASVLVCLSGAAFADEALTHTQLQRLFPGTFTAVVRGGVTLTFKAMGNGVLIGKMPGKQDQGRWSLEGGKLCIMLSNWTQGRASCSTVVSDNGWYRGQGVKFRKI